MTSKAATNIAYIDSNTDSLNSFHQNFSEYFQVAMYNTMANVLIHMTNNDINLCCLNFNVKDIPIVKFLNDAKTISPLTTFILFVNRADMEAAYEIFGQVYFDRIVLMPKKLAQIKEILDDAERDHIEKRVVLEETKIFERKVDSYRKDMFTMFTIFFEQTRLRSQVIYGHTKRVATLVIVIGRALELTERELEELQVAAYFHDYFMIGLIKDTQNAYLHCKHDNEIVYKHHSIDISNYFRYIDNFSQVSEIVKYHHIEEFPAEIQQHISLSAKILAIADRIDMEFIQERSLRAATTKALFKLRPFFDSPLLEKVRVAVDRFENKKRVRHQVLVGELKIDMILSENLYANTDHLVLSEGHKINRSDIKKIKVLLEYCDFPTHIFVYEKFSTHF